MKDALALLRVLENPWDEVSWFRVLQLPEGIGPATARRLMDQLGVRRRRTTRSASRHWSSSLTNRSACPGRAARASSSCARRLGDCLPTRA